jgi:hypothetical protein
MLLAFAVVQYDIAKRCQSGIQEFDIYLCWLILLILLQCSIDKKNYLLLLTTL